MASAKIPLPVSTQERTQLLLRIPALRMEGKVIFPGIGPMTDDDFIDLVRDALARGYRVYVKDLR